MRGRCCDWWAWRWFAAQALGGERDIVCLAKGFPLGATVARRELMGCRGAASHGTTCGGSPISGAAALATLELMREERGCSSKPAFKVLTCLTCCASCRPQAPVVGDVRGVGLMIVVEFVQPGSRQPNPEAVQRILQRCLADGLLMYPCGHWGQTIRLIPPLVVTREQVDGALEIFRRAVLAE